MEDLDNAIATAQGMIDEATAIQDYLITIKENNKIDTEVFGEIISDEMDHLLKFCELIKVYTNLETKEYQIIKKEI